MSILIKGLEMPKTCNDCPLHKLFFAFGKQNIVCLPTGHALGGIDEKHLKESRNAGYCPLVEVPTPHGRLIDADAYCVEMKKRQDAVAAWRDDIKSGGGYGTELYFRSDSVLSGFIEAKLTMDKIPTIIEAEGEGEYG